MTSCLENLAMSGSLIAVSSVQNRYGANSNGGAYRRYQANMIKPSICCGNAAFCQITLTELIDRTVMFSWVKRILIVLYLSYIGESLLGLYLYCDDICYCQDAVNGLCLSSSTEAPDSADWISSEWRQHKRHVFILSFAGKPIYSRYRDVLT